jgi:hypothetical protein
MSACRFLRLIPAVGFFVLAAVLARAGELPLQFTRLDLLDGRILRHVVIKSYDASSGKLLLVADGKAMLVPVSLIPPPFGERLKADAPQSGSTTAVVATQSASKATAEAGPRAPAAAAANADPDSVFARHKEAAQTRAQRYFRYEFRAGSDAISVTALDLEMDQPEAVEGWPGRYRIKGKAFMEFYDSKGGSFSRNTSSFEVITEQKPGQPVKVVDFTPK